MVDIVIEKLAQMLVVQPLDGLDLDPEAIGDLGYAMTRLERNLEGDLPVEPVVPGAEDLSHPTPADPIQDVVPDRPVELRRAERRDRFKRLPACRTDALHPELGTLDLDMPEASGVGTSHAEQHRAKPGRRVRGSLVSERFSGKGSVLATA